MSDHHSHDHGNDDQMHPIAKALFGWVGLKRTPDFMFYGLAIASVLLLAADFFYHRHTEVDFEGTLGFYGLYGFIAFSFVVIAGIPLGKLLRRGENYYGDAEDDAEGEG